MTVATRKSSAPRSRPHLARMRGELERLGGTFEKYVGDAVMAVFGAPVAHEDDPERAVRAALAIRDGLSGVRVGGEHRRGGRLSSVRVVRRGGGHRDRRRRHDDVPDRGGRRRRHGARRRVDVSRDAGRDRVRRAPAAPGEGEDRAGRRLRGAAREPRAARGVRGPAARAPRRPQGGAEPRSSTRSRAHDATAPFSCVTLVGVPGIGKSRLVWELQRALAGEPGLVTWRRGRCLPYGDGVTLLGARRDGQGAGRDPRERRRGDGGRRSCGRAVRELVADPREAEWVEGHLRPLLALDAPASERREEAFAAWRRAFEALGGAGVRSCSSSRTCTGPTTGLLDFLDHLADWATIAPLVLLCTARPELRERRPTWGARANAATMRSRR